MKKYILLLSLSIIFGNQNCLKTKQDEIRLDAQTQQLNKKIFNILNQIKDPSVESFKEFLKNNDQERALSLIFEILTSKQITKDQKKSLQRAYINCKKSKVEIYKTVLKFSQLMLEMENQLKITPNTNQPNQNTLITSLSNKVQEALVKLAQDTKNFEEKYKEFLNLAEEITRKK